MTDGGIGDHLLQVGLYHRHQRAVDNADQRQGADPRRVTLRLLGKQSQVEAKQTVSSHLEEDAREQYRSRGGCLNVRVGQPGMEWKEWNLDSECQEESKKQPRSRGREACHLSGSDRILNR